MDFKQLLERAQAATKSLSKAQLISLAAAFVLVMTLVVGFAYRMNSTTYRLLLSDLDPESAASVVAKLMAQKVPYLLDEGGRSIRVPEERVDELRLELSSQGMPNTGRIGFEIFDKTAFGATEFLEKVNYRSALEGEIARTIGSITEIASARVHIAMAKESLFGAQEQPAKASVFLKLKNSGRQLAPTTARAIQSLVSSSIEGLRSDMVDIVDDHGRKLAKTADTGEDAVDGVQSDRQQRYERELAGRVVALLEPVVGADRVRANVSVRLNSRTEEQTEERYDPSSAVVRSRQTQNDGAAAGAGSGGVAGSRSNLPPAAPTPANAATAPAGATMTAALVGGRAAETANFEINKTVRHTLVPRGDIARLSVAVMVDDDEVAVKSPDGRTTKARKARDGGELKKIQTLVAAAVGFDASRGDQLSVEAIPFDEPIVIEEPVPTPIWRQVVEQPRVLTVVLIAAGVVVVGVVLFVVARRFRRRVQAEVVEEVPVLPKALPRTVDQVQNELESQLQNAENKSVEGKRSQVLVKRVTQMIDKEPEHVARLLRTWLTEEGR